MIEQETEVFLNQALGPALFLMGLRAPEIAEMSHPGQFVMIRVGLSGDPLLRRPFAICAVRDKGRLFILYQVVGRGTSMLSRVRSGDRLSVVGPLGRGFVFPEKREAAVLAAGGMGIAPLFFLAERLDDWPQRFLAGFRSAGEAVPLDRLTAIGGPFPDIRVSTDDGSIGHYGFVTDMLRAAIHEIPEAGAVVYACGPVPMMKEAARLAKEKGMPCQVSLETVMACGLGLCQGCAVKASKKADGKAYLRVCVEGPVFFAEELDWQRL